MATAGSLKRAADDELFAGRFEAALRLYAQWLEMQPASLDARLRTGDALLALGEVQRAAVVYTKLAQYAAHASYPLHALVALKILSTLEPELAGLVRSIAELYGSDSARLGRGTRRSPPPAEEPLPRNSAPAGGTLPELVAHASALAAEYRAEPGALPDKLMPMPLLSTLDRDELARVLALLELIRVQPGAVVLEQGSDEQALYVLARGAVRVQRSDAEGRQQLLAELQPGAVFGELSFLSRTPRSAAVLANTDCDLLRLSTAALDGAGATAVRLRQLLADFARERLLAYVMNHSPLFTPLDPGQRRDLIKRFVEVEAPQGAAIIRQGQPGQGAYVVLRGEVAVSRTEDGRSVHLARLGPGELFGEMSLLTGSGASSTVTATMPSALLWLEKSIFDRLMEAVPHLREELEALVHTRASRIAASFAPPQPGGDDEIVIEVLL